MMTRSCLSNCLKRNIHKRRGERLAVYLSACFGYSPWSLLKTFYLFATTKDKAGDIRGGLLQLTPVVARARSGLLGEAFPEIARNDSLLLCLRPDASHTAHRASRAASANVGVLVHSSNA